ncbi:Glutathione import ATP-binding protein GsiA [Planktothrix serta PCC 8927]|uniref:Glutathione import ATP-binding protein GsiA n=1 Tax=Planktothrix serta PCC 8927 TaxID=671068 RepID=A0A7Z9BSR8_9CYAN|nr:ABC transporter ATP-binding protein [Planktothrix serta]VXD17082.1 Glutathione import ATP-binding protein GsiA [Planktothrix serta PCC 8927]
MPSLFDVEHLRVAYPHSRTPQSWAVNDISFSLQPGERLGLVGESGCGKSTIGRAVMRLLPNTSEIEGQVRFEGQPVFGMDEKRLRQFRGEAVALIFQDPMTRLDPLMTIGDHCLETLKAHRPQLSNSQAKNKALEILEAVKIPANRWSQYPHEFSGGMRQRVAIALALLLDPKLIVADEPTTSLDVTVSAQILKELTRLCEQRGTAILLISHDLAMVGEYCHKIAVMYQGKMVEMGSSQTVFQSPQHPYTQSLLKSALHLQDIENKETNPTLETPGSSGQPLLSLKNLQQHYTLESSFLQQLFSKQKKSVIKAVDGINLELYPGEILGLVGESGCGKSTLSRTILQLIRATNGSVEFLGTDLTKLSREQVRKYRRQMQMVFQDPHACLNPMMTVGESIADPLLIHQLATPEEAKKQVLAMLERVGLTPTKEYYQRYPGELSGGQQQRVAIARALMTHPQLLICDEPVSMLDASVQAQVLELMLELKREFNLTYLFITHDLWVARFLCDRIAVMNQGKIVELGTTEDLFTNPQHPYTQTLLSAVPSLSKLKQEII